MRAGMKMRMKGYDGLASAGIKPTLYFDPTEPPAATAENRPKNTFDPPISRQTRRMRS